MGRTRKSRQRRQSRPHLSVIIPAFNEERRLGPTLDAILDHLRQRSHSWELIVVDDGSDDATADIAASRPDVRLVRSPVNRGKGNAVKVGVLAARGERVFFTDADLCTPMSDLDRVLAPLDDEADVVVGSRHAPGASILTKQPWTRVLLGAVMRMLMSVFLRGVRDTQCGFKALAAPAARHIFGQMEVDRFAFDVEMLVVARQLGYRIREVGVTWSDRPGSTVAPIRDSVRVLRDLLRIRRATPRRLLAAVAGHPRDDELATAVLTLPAGSRTDCRAGDERLVAADGTVVLVAHAMTGDAAEAWTARHASAELARLPMAVPAPTVRRVAVDAESESHPGQAAERMAADAGRLEQRRDAWRRRRATVRTLVGLNLLGMAWWAVWLFDLRHAATGWLYGLLVAAEAFNLTQVLGYWYTAWHAAAPDESHAVVEGSVDVFITTYNEDPALVRRTVVAALAMHRQHSTWILDDGNRPAMRALAAELGAGYLARGENTGAKAGNINHALTQTSGRFVAVFDADHVPHADFLDRLLPWMADDRIALVQGPQYYANRDVNYVAAAAMDQQEIFFGPICEGKDGLGAVFCCGTNMILRRAALEEIGGFNETSVTEDAVTSLALHAAGWRSKYVGERIADGLAPEDLGGFLSQQRRWARGNLQMLLRMAPWRRRMPWRLRAQYMWSSMYYLSGLPTLVYLTLPVLFLLFGVETVGQRSDDFILHFFPYIFITLFILARSAEGRLRFRAVQFSYGLFPVFIASLASVLTGRRVGFHVTPKVGTRQSFFRLVVPQMLVVGLCLVSVVVGFVHYSGARTITNACWALFNVVLLSGVIRGALPQHVRAVDTDAAAAGAIPVPARATLHERIAASLPHPRMRRRALAPVASGVFSVVAISMVAAVFGMTNTDSVFHPSAVAPNLRGGPDVHRSVSTPDVTPDAVVPVRPAVVTPRASTPAASPTSVGAVLAAASAKPLPSAPQPAPSARPTLPPTAPPTSPATPVPTPQPTAPPTPTPAPTPTLPPPTPTATVGPTPTSHPASGGQAAPNVLAASLTGSDLPLAAGPNP